MALGIGANVALFTVVRNVILKPLPFKDPDRLIMFYEDSVRNPGKPDFNVVAGGVYQEWKKQNHTFSDLALVGNTRVNLSGTSGQLPEKLNGASFPGIFFRLSAFSQRWAATSSKRKTAPRPMAPFF